MKALPAKARLGDTSSMDVSLTENLSPEMNGCSSPSNKELDSESPPPDDELTLVYSSDDEEDSRIKITSTKANKANGETESTGEEANSDAVSSAATSPKVNPKIKNYNRFKHPEGNRNAGKKLRNGTTSTSNSCEFYNRKIEKSVKLHKNKSVIMQDVISNLSVDNGAESDAMARKFDVEEVNYFDFLAEAPIQSDALMKRRIGMNMPFKRPKSKFAYQNKKKSKESSPLKLRVKNRARNGDTGTMVARISKQLQPTSCKKPNKQETIRPLEALNSEKLSHDTDKESIDLSATSDECKDANTTNDCSIIETHEKKKTSFSKLDLLENDTESSSEEGDMPEKVNEKENKDSECNDLAVPVKEIASKVSVSETECEGSAVTESCDAEISKQEGSMDKQQAEEMECDDSAEADLDAENSKLNTAGDQQDSIDVAQDGDQQQDDEAQEITRVMSPFIEDSIDLSSDQDNPVSDIIKQLEDENSVSSDTFRCEANDNSVSDNDSVNHFKSVSNKIDTVDDCENESTEVKIDESSVTAKSPDIEEISLVVNSEESKLESDSGDVTTAECSGDSVQECRKRSLEPSDDVSNKRARLSDEGLNSEAPSPTLKLEQSSSEKKVEISDESLECKPEGSLTEKETAALSNIKTMTRKELEKMLFRKTIEVVGVRSKLAKSNQQIMAMQEKLADYKKKIQPLVKQVHDMNNVIVRLEQMTKKSAKPVRPLKVTRSVGLQVINSQIGHLTSSQGSPPSQPARGIRTLQPVAKLSEQPSSPVQSSQATNKLRVALPGQGLPSPNQVVRSAPPVNHVAPVHSSPKSIVARTARTTNIISPQISNAEVRAQPLNLVQQPGGRLSIIQPQNGSAPVAYLVQSQQNRQILFAPTNQAGGRSLNPMSLNTVQLVRGLPRPQGTQPNILQRHTNASSTAGVTGQVTVRAGTSAMALQKGSLYTVGPTAVTSITRPTSLLTSRHPAPLPPIAPHPPSRVGWKLPPPKPVLKISRVPTGIVLSWNMPLTTDHEEMKSYQIYAYQESKDSPSSSAWKTVGDVQALALPMACTLTQFKDGNKYHFSVRAVDVHSRMGPHSDPTSIMLPRC